MKHRFRYLYVLPVLAAMASYAQAGHHFRCGGCSDPCRTAGFSTAVSASPCAGQYSAGPSSSIAYGVEGTSMATGGCGSTILEAGPVTTGYVTSAGSYASSQPVVDTRQTLCEPITGYRMVMESQYVTETIAQPATETKTETRYRTKTVYKTVPVTEEAYRTKTVMTPKTETKTVEYTVLVPEQSTKTVDVTVSVPVWNEVSESYTVKVPQVIDVPESYQVRVPSLRDEEFTYTVYVPQTETVTKMQTITNAVPVTKTKTVSRVVPVYSTKTVTRDAGHYETVVEEVASAATVSTVSSSNGCGSSYAASSPCGSTGGCGSAAPSCGCGSPAPVVSSSCGCSTPAPVSTGCGCGSTSTGCGSMMGGCGSSTAVASSSMSGGCGSAAPAVQTVSRQVWVPNIVSEEVPVVSSTTKSEEITYTVYEQQSEQIPYECTYVVNKPEQRTGTRKVVEYKTETRERTRKQVKYVDEQRTRVRKELSYKTETKQESYPVVSYKTEKKTKEISYTYNVPETVTEPYQTTRYEQVAEDVVEEYTVNVEVPTMKEVTVQVCKMVPKLVPYTYNPCAEGMSSSGVATGNGVSYSSTGGCGGAAPVSSGSSGCGCGTPAPAPAPCGCGS
jgi:hypothetical protein